MSVFISSKSSKECGFGLKRLVSYGVSNLLVGSQEDAFSCYPNHGQDNLENFASFGVFDGHNGVR
jgi:serine/threonine protein phosphatase PrpC